MSEVLLDSYLQAGPRLTRSGYKYTPSDDHWYIVGAGRGRHFRFYEMKGYLSSKLIDEVKVGIVASLERLAVATTQLRFRQLKRFVLASYVDGSEIDRITGLDFLNYTQTTKPDNGRKLRVFLREMHALNLGGLTSTDIEIIDQVDLPSPTPHLAQKTLDPVKGPYTVEEFDCLRSAIHESYENNKIGDKDYLILILINVFGLRPKQIALLKICDLIISATEAGRVEYSLNVPRVKQGTVGERYAFTCRKLGAEIGEYFSLWVEELGSEISSRGIKLKYDEGLFPLFPLWNPRKREINMVSQGDYEYHSGGDRIKQIAGNCIAQAINEKSHRTGRKLIANSRRARHFIGTTMAVNGCGRRVIAHALDHTSLESSKAYVQFGQEAVEEIDKSIAPYQKPLIDAFRGKIFEKPSLFGTRQTYNPVRSSLNTDEVGMCVSPSGCAIYSVDTGEPRSFLARVPFSCYRCWNFNAFSNLEVHKEHLKILKREKKLSLKAYDEEGSSTQTGLAMSYDPMIRAIEDVIAKIEGGDISEFNLETDMVDSF